MELWNSWVWGQWETPEIALLDSPATCEGVGGWFDATDWTQLITGNASGMDTTKVS